MWIPACCEEYQDSPSNACQLQINETHSLKCRWYFYFIYFLGGKCLYSTEVSLYDLFCSDRHTYTLHSTSCDLFLLLALPSFLFFSFPSDYLQSRAHLMSVHGSSVYTFLVLNLHLCLGLTAGNALARSKSPSYLVKKKKKSVRGNYGRYCNLWTRQQRRCIWACGRIINCPRAPRAAVPDAMEWVF